jgi:hypothetical protein
MSIKGGIFTIKIINKNQKEKVKKGGADEIII